MPITDIQMLNELQRTLMEPEDDGVTIASGLWTPQEVRDRMNERQNRFLKTTGLLAGLAAIDVVAGTFRYALPQDWLATIGAYWFGSDGDAGALERSDSFDADHGLPTWETTGATRPLLYMDMDPPLLEIQIGPIPTVPGTLLLRYIPQGATLDGTGELITVPDECAADVCKYGTLADLLAKDGRGASPDRASYCEGRYAVAQAVAGILLRGRV